MLRNNPTLQQHTSHSSIIVYVFAGDLFLSIQIFLLYIHRSHFRCEIFCFNTDGREEICQRPIVGSTQLTFQQCCIQMKQCPVTFGTDNTKSLVVHPTFVKNARQTVLSLCQLVTCHDTFMLQYSFLHKFSPPRLHRKIVLGKCHLWFARISILGNKVTGIASQYVVIHLTLSTFGKFYHFAGISKMISRLLSGIFTGRLGFLYDILKVTPLGITKQDGKFSCTPAFHPFVFIGDGLKLLEQFYDFFGFHTFFCGNKDIKSS